VRLTAGLYYVISHLNDNNDDGPSDVVVLVFQNDIHLFIFE